MTLVWLFFSVTAVDSSSVSLLMLNNDDWALAADDGSQVPDESELQVL